MAEVLVRDDIVLTEIANAIRETHKIEDKMRLWQMPNKIRERIPGHLDTSMIEDWSYYNYNGCRDDTLPYIDTRNGWNFSRFCANSSIYAVELHCEKADEFIYAFYNCQQLNDLTLYFGEIRTTYMTQCFRDSGQLINVVIHGKIILDNNGFNIAYSSYLTPESVDSIISAMEKDNIDAERVISLATRIKNKLLNSVKVTESNPYTAFDYASEEEWLAYKNIMNKISDKKISLG